ncbi:MAG: conserved repeat domain protein [halophilic archaeon J07HB67]|nr:MAG: conserved repeat domain protein [halophilic archaeon J07HB67]
MRLTNRGIAVCVVCVGAVASAVLFGPRALNAVVVPGVLALAAAYVQVSRTDAPTAVRETPGDGHVGRGGTVELSFVEHTAGSGSEPLARPFVGRVTETTPDGVQADETTQEIVVGAEPAAYEVTYETRGRHTLGPATVTARDVLGLLEEDRSCPGTDTVLAYPELRAIAAWARRDLRALHETGVHEEREEFDRLREYTDGDSLRDVHWQTTAKRDELIVKEFAAEAETEAVSLAVGATPGGADGMASATASLALALLEDGVPVVVTLPGGTVAAGPDRGSRTRLLERLASVGPGRVSTDDADIVVFGETNETTVGVGDEQTTFQELTADRQPVYRAETDHTAPEPDREVVA